MVNLLLRKLVDFFFILGREKREGIFNRVRTWILNKSEVFGFDSNEQFMTENLEGKAIVRNLWNLQINESKAAAPPHLSARV